MDDELVLAIITGVAGLFLGMILLLIVQKIKLKDFERLSQAILQKAEDDAQKKLQTAAFEIKQKELISQEALHQIKQKEERKLKDEEERLSKKQERIEAHLQALEKKWSEFEKKEEAALDAQEKLKFQEKDLRAQSENLLKEYEKLAKISEDEARHIFFKRIETELKEEKEKAIKDALSEVKSRVDEESRRLIALSIGRLAVPCISECTLATVHLPSEEIKARIIGKEGRNIRSLERISGVNFLIDETPKAIVISGFDPFRIQTAKLALGELVQDGRIHPTRIEEMFEKAKETLDARLKKIGEEAAFKVGVFNLSPFLINLLGHLSLRYSFGQNVLEHSLEVSFLMGVMAAELQLDIKLAKRIGLLHDIGKAVSHEMEGTHAMIGMQLALKHGEAKEVANGIGCHHQEIEAETIEASLCASADSLSAARPGARNEAVDDYIKRLSKLEEMACSFKEVDQAFALQAGREVRIFVKPDLVDDAGMASLARDLRKKIELNLSYPGKIKVAVLREKKIVEYAM